MEKLYFNLSEEQFSKERKILLWSFATLFFLAAVYILIANLVLGHKNIPLFISLITFGISLFVCIIAAFATIRRKDLFFIVNEEKIEFRFGIISPKRHTFLWIDIKELVMPHKQKKVMLFLNNGSSFLINLNWLQKRKSSLIRKHIYLEAKVKNLKVTKVPTLQKKLVVLF
jgi:hypothetical protein